jgi:hypothetical protein
MTTQGFGNVPDRGFLAFASDLVQGAWESVSTRAYEDAHERPAGLLDAPLSVTWKLRIGWSIRALRDVLGSGGDEVAALEGAWDRTQRKLHALITAHENDANQAVCDAAVRVRQRLLHGQGTGQTRLPFQSEVDFGRKQVQFASETPVRESVALLGLGPVIDEIARTTEALAAGLGRLPDGVAHAAQSQRIRNAMKLCRDCFASVLNEIDELAGHVPSGPEHDRLLALRAPLAALRDRYAAPAAHRPAPAPTDPSSSG